MKTNNTAAVTFPLMGFSRHRLGSDGAGVTTLAAARGCPLRCAFCLNPQCFAADTNVRRVTPEELYDMAKIDDLYFRATGGGVTFGGGEPLIHADFIRAFRELCGGWRITAETCLNISEKNLLTAIDCADDFLVDIKDTDPEIYRRYTGKDNGTVIKNLRLLLKTAGPDRVTVRVPRIPGFNTAKDVANSTETLRKMGFTKIDVFTYKIP